MPKHDWFGLLPVRSPLLRESRLISFRRATEMFQFTRCPPHGLCVQPWVSRHHSGGVAPFGYSGFFAWMQLPLNVSPVSASFFGFKRQGIHLVLFFACASLVRCFLLTSSRSRSHAHAFFFQARTFAFLCFSLSSCLGNIEVILLFGFLMYKSGAPDT